MHNLAQQSYIAGEWISPTGASFQAQDPVNLDCLAEHHNCQISDVDTAMKSALNAFHTYKKISAAARAKFLHAIADEIDALGEQLLTVCDQETGLGIPRLTGERLRTVHQIKGFAEMVANQSWTQASIDTAEPDRAPLPKPDLRKMRQPIGPISVFGASNFPFAYGTLGGDTASALAAGNPVIVKGHPSHPATNELFAIAIDRAIARCGIPKGVFSLLQGNATALSIQLVTHPANEAVGFTGSLQGGRAIMDAAAARDKPIPVFAEMGSVNPIFISKQALEDSGNTIAQNLASSVCLGTGQFCTSPGIIVVQKNSYFAENVATTMNALPKNVMLNKGIALAFANGVEHMLEHSEVEWVNRGENTLNQSLVPPNIVLKTTADFFLQTKSLQHEVFGPATLVVECDDENQFLQIAVALEGNLTASLHSSKDDSQMVKNLVATLEQKVGRIIFDGFPTGVEVCGSQHHGGPYPASSDGSSTSVGSDAINRFTRFVSYQNAPTHLLPAELQDQNPHKIMRRINGQFSFDEIKSR